MEEKNIQIEELLSPTIPIIILVFLSGIILPFLLLLIIGNIGHSEIIEEIVKALVIVFLINRIPKNRSRLILAIMFGFLFGLSENIAYLGNILVLNNTSIFFERFITTIPMHMFTCLVVSISALKHKWFVILGLALAILIHIFFNNSLAPYLSTMLLSTY